MLSCFFPTTVVLVDDNVAFINSLKIFLEANNIVCKTFTRPLEALNYINDIGKMNKLDYSDLIRDGEESTSDWKSILLNINDLHREIYSTNRFLKISAVVSDYMMGELNGIELCSNIYDKDIQRILLTGVAEDKSAIEAFNSGYITRFIKKGSDDFEETVIDSVKKSVHRYFSIYTDYISKHLSIVDGSHLNDPVFANFFSKVYESDDYIEYYMLDAFGSYLFLKSDGQAKMLCVLTESEISRIVEIGLESDEIGEDVLSKLQSRKYMLVSHSRVGLLPPISEWGKYICPAERINGYQTYYFSMSDTIDIDAADIKSFDLFKRSMSANR
jgi:CheY-like chemotaxis protein